jgi:phage gp29-like protein
MEKGLYINPTTFVQLNQINEKLTSEIATRQFALGGFAGYFNYLPDPDPILRKLNMDQQVYKDLTSDSRVFAMESRRKNLTKHLDWQIDRSEGAGDKEMELAQLTVDTLANNGFKMKDIISQSLNAIGYGYSVFEIVWGNINGYWLPVKLEEKPREYFTFDTENQLRFRNSLSFLGVPVRGAEADPAVAMKFILLQNDPTYENPYGQKVLARCFWPVTFKRGGMRFYAQFIEKYGMPFIFGKLPRGAKQEDHNDFLSKLSNMIQDAVGTGPDDSSIEIIESKGTSSADLHEKFINRCDNATSEAWLTNSLSTSIQKVGGRSSSETGAQTIESNISEEDRDLPSTLWDEVFKRVTDINIGSGLYPRFRVFEEEKISGELALRDKNLYDQGFRPNKKYFVEKYNMDENQFEVNQAPAGNPLQLNPMSQLQNTNQPDPLQLSGLKKIWNKITGKRVELSDAATNQTIADLISNALPDKTLQFAIEQTLKPVIELAKNSNSREEFENGIAALYPKMKTDDIQNLITKVLFITECEGFAEASKGK